MADRISDLPEAILCHILSFLSTKQVVATSVLSKRWKPLWRFVPTLDFNDANYVQTQEIFDYGNYAEQKETYFGFLRSVSTVLLLRDSHHSIQKFRLRCSSIEFYDPIYVCEWIITALQSRVEHLHLSLPLNWRRRVSSIRRIDPIIPIINCSSLVVLNLEDLILEPTSSAYFPSLRILSMKNVGFLDDSYGSKFLSGCPILENLNLHKILSRDLITYYHRSFYGDSYFYWSAYIINCSTLAVLKLKNLEMKKNLSSPYFPSLKILYMENLRMNDLSWLFKFCSGCPNLEDLKTKGYFFFYWGCKNFENLKTKGYIHCKCICCEGKIEILPLPKLVRASIRRDHVFLLKAVTNAKFLHITEREDPQQLYPSGGEMDEDDFPPYHNGQLYGNAGEMDEDEMYWEEYVMV